MASPRASRGARQVLGLAVASLLVGVSTAFACAVARPLPGILKVGLVAPFSGRYYSTGYSLLFATRLALREWNQRGGVGGYRLELVAQDDGDTAAGGSLQSEKMKRDPDVIGVIGHPSDDSALASLRRAGAGRVAGAGHASPADWSALALITFGPTSEVQEKDHFWTLRLNAADGAIARFVVQVATDTLKARRVAIFSGSGEDSSRQAQAVAEALGKAQVAVAYQGSLPQDTPDYKAEAEEAARAAPDLVFFAGPFDQGASLRRQLRAAGVEAVFLGGPGTANPELALMAEGDAKGPYYLSLAPHPRDLPQAQEFRARYRELSGVEPDAMAALAYDATNLLLTAAERALARPDRSRLREAIFSELTGLEDFPGITGPITASAGERVGAQVYLYRLSGPSFPGELVAPRP